MKREEAKMKLTDVYANANALKSDMEVYSSFIPTDFSYDILYNLLVSKYGARSISSNDEQTFRNRLCGITFQYAPSWWRQLEIQRDLRNLTSDELVRGALQVSSLALNPADIPAGSEEGLDTPIIKTINQQTTSQYRKSKLDAYNGLVMLLKQDVTNDFLNRYKNLFKLITFGPEPKEKEQP